MADRSFLFGLIVVKAYGYWWGYTAAQIQLMVADAPIVVYGDRKSDGKPSHRRIEEVRDKWENKYKGGARRVSLDEILNDV